jgi:hypothetical protein
MQAMAPFSTARDLIDAVVRTIEPVTHADLYEGGGNIVGCAACKLSGKA